MCVCMYMYMNNEFRVMACCMHGTFNTVRIDPSLCALPTCTYVHISQSAPWGSATLCDSPPPWHNIFSIILFLSTTLLTRMIGISLHVQWPLTSHSHGSYLKGKIGVFVTGQTPRSIFEWIFSWWLAGPDEHRAEHQVHCIAKHPRFDVLQSRRLTSAWHLRKQVIIL
jgi:hypothetical protein